MLFAAACIFILAQTRAHLTLVSRVTTVKPIKRIISIFVPYGSRRVTPRTRGFSAVEMAIVVIVLGLGMVMTLKGAVMIEIFRAFVASYELESYQRWIQLYAVEYKYLPGDDPKAPGRYLYSTA